MLWIIGTSVSIEDGGYATRLQDRARAELVITSINLSVGDQTSLMGCMRALAYAEQISEGDVVVWEYSLLDTLLAGDAFAADDVHAARRMAWRRLIERGASVLVLMVPPLVHARNRAECEDGILADAKAFGLECIDVRDVFAALGIRNPSGHYRDDRHPRQESPVVDAIVAQVLDFLGQWHGKTCARDLELPSPGRERHWLWMDARALAAPSGHALETFRNSLLATEAVVLGVDRAIAIPLASRVVALGVLSTHRSGGAWCRHPGCAPASTRLPSDLNYAFLMRSTGIPCVRASIDAIASAPKWAYGRGTWAAYGQALCSEPGKVGVFGLLYEQESRNTLDESRTQVEIRTSHPNGHFYSPVVDPVDIASRSDAIWAKVPDIRGIDFNDSSHRQILESEFPAYYPDYDYPEHLEESTSLESFYTQNSQFSWLDCRSLFVLLRAWRPARYIEVGSGFSTLLAADVNVRFLGGGMDITCIEPYPRPFLTRGFPGLGRLVQSKVQDIPLERFAMLEAGDVLFIDSSHVAKTGSDVNFLYFEVLPRLKPGVRIHIHDIFLPHDYPRGWVIGENRSWNEQYILRALLMYSKTFEIVFSSNYAFWRFPELVCSALAYQDRRGFGGGSIWLERRQEIARSSKSCGQSTAGQ